MSLALRLAVLLLVQEDSRKPVPEPEAQAAAEKIIREVFSEEYRARGRDERRAFAARLLGEAGKLTNDDTTRYVLCREALDFASHAGDVGTALKAIRILSREYRVEEAELTQDALETAGPLAKAPSDQANLIEAYLGMADLASKRGEVDNAYRIAQDAYRLARKLKNVPLVSRVRRRIKEYERLKKRVQRVELARKKLKSTPEDPKANLEVGRYECFILEKWESGLRYLSQGTDEQMKQAAELDLGMPEKAQERLRVADLWWEVGKSATDEYKAGILGRAEYWYRLAIEGVSGLTKMKVEHRLKALGKDLKSQPVEKPGIERIIRFRSAADARLFVTSGGTWSVQGGMFRGSCPTGSEWATLNAYFDSIQSIRIRAQIVPPSTKNFRLWIGPIHAIFNWEISPENHFRNDDPRRVVTRPPALTPGRDHDISLVQDGGEVVLAVDGKEHFRVNARLEGTLSFQGAVRNTIGIREIRIVGIPNTARRVTVERREHPGK